MLVVTFENPTGVVCEDCPLQCRWYPRSDREADHKHALVTGHEVRYVPASQIDVDIDSYGDVEYRHVPEDPDATVGDSQ